MFAGCPITWGSKLQTEIALSTTESEYIALSSAMREVIPFMGLVQEISQTFGLINRKPVFKCTVPQTAPNGQPYTKVPPYILYFLKQNFLAGGAIFSSFFCICKACFQSRHFRYSSPHILMFKFGKTNT